MYPAAHAAIALACTKAGERLLPRTWLPVDYRFAALGALLPDLIDKPPAYFLGLGHGHGHTIAHTLVFALAVILCGLIIACGSRDLRLLLVGLGSLSHLLVDPVIVYPRTLFWPLFGFEFADSMGIPSLILRLIDAVLISALGIVWWLSISFRKRISTFIKSGALETRSLITDY